MSGRKTLEENTEIKLKPHGLELNNGLVLQIKSLSEKSTLRLIKNFKKSGKDVDIFGYVPVTISKASLSLKTTVDIWEDVFQYATEAFGGGCKICVLNAPKNVADGYEELVIPDGYKTAVKYFVIYRQN